MMLTMVNDIISCIFIIQKLRPATFNNTKRFFYSSVVGNAYCVYIYFLTSLVLNHVQLRHIMTSGKQCPSSMATYRLLTS